MMKPQWELVNDDVAETFVVYDRANERPICSVGEGAAAEKDGLIIAAARDLLEACQATERAAHAWEAYVTMIRLGTRGELTPDDVSPRTLYKQWKAIDAYAAELRQKAIDKAKGGG